MFSPIIVATLLSFSFAQEMPVIGIGKLALGGSACGITESFPDIYKHTLSIPVPMTVKKETSQKMQRGACNFSLPLQLPPSHRLVIYQAQAEGYLNLAPSSSSILKLEVFKAGSVGQIIDQQINSKTRRIRKTINMERQAEILATSCGESLILRGNLSARLTGESRSTAKINTINLNFVVENCNLNQPEGE